MESRPKIWTIREVDDSHNVVLVDLDGTLAQNFEEVFDPRVIGELRQDVALAIAQLREHGDRIVIWTARTSSYWKRREKFGAPNNQEKFQIIHEWMVDHGIEYDGILDWDKPLFSSYLCDNSFNADNWQALVRERLGKGSSLDQWLGESSTGRE